MLKTPLINERVKLIDIGYEGKLLDASDILPRRIQMFNCLTIIYILRLELAKIRTSDRKG